MKDFILRLTIELFKKHTNLLNDKQNQEDFEKFAGAFLIASEDFPNPLGNHIIVLQYFDLLNKYLSGLKENSSRLKIQLPEHMFVAAFVLAHKIQTDDSRIYLNDFKSHYDTSKHLINIKTLETLKFINGSEVKFSEVETLKLLNDLEVKLLGSIHFDVLVDFHPSLSVNDSKIKNYSHLKAAIFFFLNDDELNKKFQDEKLPEYPEPIHELIDLLDKNAKFLEEIEDFEDLSEELLNLREKNNKNNKNMIFCYDQNEELFNSAIDFLLKMSDYLFFKSNLSFITDLKIMVSEFRNSDKLANLLLDKLEICFNYFMDILAEETDDPIIFSKIHGLLLDENNSISPQGVRECFYKHLLNQKYDKGESILHVLALEYNTEELPRSIKKLKDLISFIKQNYPEEKAKEILSLKNNLGQTYEDVLVFGLEPKEGRIILRVLESKNNTKELPETLEKLKNRISFFEQNYYEGKVNEISDWEKDLPQTDKDALVFGWEPQKDRSILHVLASKNNSQELPETLEKLKDRIRFIKENYPEHKANEILNLKNNFGQTYKDILVFGWGSKKNWSILHVLASKNKPEELPETIERLNDIINFIKENYSKDEANEILDWKNGPGQTYKDVLVFGWGSTEKESSILHVPISQNNAEELSETLKKLGDVIRFIKKNFSENEVNEILLLKNSQGDSILHLLASRNNRGKLSEAAEKLENFIKQHYPKEKTNEILVLKNNLGQTYKDILDPPKKQPAPEKKLSTTKSTDKNPSPVLKKQELKSLSSVNLFSNTHKKGRCRQEENKKPEHSPSINRS